MRRQGQGTSDISHLVFMPPVGLWVVQSIFPKYKFLVIPRQSPHSLVSLASSLLVWLPLRTLGLRRWIDSCQENMVGRAHKRGSNIVKGTKTWKYGKFKHLPFHGSPKYNQIDQIWGLVLRDINLNQLGCIHLQEPEALAHTCVNKEVYWFTGLGSLEVSRLQNVLIQ
jgi:hypothetical protein